VRHVRMLGLCLVAALALGAYAVSSASALEWGKCVFVGPGGNYNENPENPGTSNCTKAEKAKPKGNGEYEWRKASEVAAEKEAEKKWPGVRFTGASTTPGVLGTLLRQCSIVGRKTRQQCAEEGGTVTAGAEPLYVECTSETNKGETSGKNQIANIFVKFNGCLAFGKIACQNTVTSGEILVNALKGKLGYITKSPLNVGVMLEPEHHHGEFAKFTCGPGVGQVVGVGNKKEGTEYTSSGCSGTCEGATPEEEKHGGYDEILSPITPVNQMTTEFEQVFKVNEETFENEPRSFEGKHISLLEDYTYNATKPNISSMWSPAGETITNVNKNELAGEIKA
jgi:hypothetical protein